MLALNAARSIAGASLVFFGVAPLGACSSSTTNTLPNTNCPSCTPDPGSGAGNGATPGPTGGGGGGGGGGADGGGGGGGTTTSSSETWANGKQLAASVVIDTASTVTIAPGATITCAAGVTITVKGKLTASSASAHAKITGASWGGIVVASGGTMTLDGVDLENATTALYAQGGDAAATYDNGTLTAPGTPFKVDVGGKLSTSHSAVTGTKGATSISGAFVASHLDYDSNGHEGIATGDKSATLTIDDSLLHGPSPFADMIVADGAASVHVAYTEITSVHCAFHFNDVTAFDLSNMTIHGNAWGFMLYGSSGTGSRTIKNSNIESNTTYDLDDGAGTNGPISVDSCYIAGPNKLVSGQVTLTNPAGAAVPNATERP